MKQTLSALGAGGRGPRLVAAIAVLTALRFVLAAVLPLAFDEAYYWLWSQHLAASYYDHPPAIAYAIRAGTILFGDTALGVRFAALLASVLASWCVWQSALILLGDAQRALLACLYFNLTLMVASQAMAATPDALALAASSLVLYFLARLAAGGEGWLWLAAGASGGLCLLSKYTGVFLGAGVLFWLVATPQGRKWLPTAWPYAGGVLALLIFLPVILWNASHDWISFKFQFGRAATGGFTLRYFGEFVLSELALASPFILILGGAGFARATRFRGAAPAVTLAAALMWPALVYFVVHATHDRVQGNWPSFIFPAFAILAAWAADEDWRGTVTAPLMRIARAMAVPVAALMLVLVYAEAFFGVVPARDPIARLTAVGFKPVARSIANLAEHEHAAAIVTSSYATTAWLKFYGETRLPIVPVTEPYRWQFAPKADPALASQTLLYVNLEPRNPQADARGEFAHAELLARVPRLRRKAVIDRYDVYRVSGWPAATSARVP